MNAHAPRPRRRAFVVPRDDVRWCAALAEALSVCCSGPSDARVAEVRALLAQPPEQMLQAAWRDLVSAAESWLVVAEGWDAQRRPRFDGLKIIETALRDKVLPVPAWAGWYQ
jgi:hypothetical protein